jgi:hypothetical protein
VRYLPQSLMSDVPRIVTGLRVGQSFSTIPVPNAPIIRKGASGTFYDKGLEGVSHHAVIPNVNTIDKLREKTVLRHHAGLSGRPDARLPLPSDNRNARRPLFPIPRCRPGMGP